MTTRKDDSARDDRANSSPTTKPHESASSRDPRNYDEAKYHRAGATDGARSDSSPESFKRKGREKGRLTDKDENVNGQRDAAAPARTATSKPSR
jgi:hypothetical protein